MTVVSLCEVSKYYVMPCGKSHSILHNISLDVHKGDFISIVGPSGSGKTTLLKILGLIDNPSVGGVVFDSTECADMSDNQLTTLRQKHIGFVFQSFNLLPDFTAIENVIIAQDILGVQRSVSKKAAMSLLKTLNVSHVSDHYPSQMSGGEQQRVAIARSLINGPKLLLADEPTGNLDSKNAENVVCLLRDVAQEPHGAAVVVVTHNISVAELSNNRYTLRDGKLLNAS